MRAVVLPAELRERTFEAILFDWDGTAVPDRHADATMARALVEDLCAAGTHVLIVSGTHVGNVDGQLQARPSGPGQLHLCLNRGSEVFSVTTAGPTPVHRREATPEEDDQLDRAAAATVHALAQRGLAARIVSERLNRRKIDLIPEPAWADPPKARIAELLDAVSKRLRAAGIGDLNEVVTIATAASSAAGLAHPRITSDVKHVEIGLTDKADSARWAAAWLAQRGITGGLVLVGGDELGPLGGVTGSDSKMVVDELARALVISVGAEPEGCPDGVLHLEGGPERFLAVLSAQLERRRARRVPSIDHDPAWVVILPGDPALMRVSESLGALSNGWAGTRGALEEDGVGTASLFVVGGEYAPVERSPLLAGPRWTSFEIPGETGVERREVDLRSGVLLRTRQDDTGLRTVRFMSMTRPHALAMRAEAAPACQIRTTPPDPPETPGITVEVRDWRTGTDDRTVIERLATWSTSSEERTAGTELPQVADVGFDRLLAEHRECWAQRWADAEVAIDGAPEDELAARFAVFHLLSAAHAGGEAAVGARGLTGPAYGGHVFWDADVFVLPALAAMWPAAARAMLEYRLRRVSAAQATARALGGAGARFPWESAAEGVDVTPPNLRGPTGEIIPIRTGAHEEHIVADVAWAANEYARWSGDDAFLTGPGRALVVEAARWWASRIRLDADGRGHLYGVMGPDEYHEVVDDDAFTNVMARWNLRRAADLHDHPSAGRTAEAARWRYQADSLVDGYDPSTGLYEQFAGYWRLEPLLVSDIATPPVAADVLLGPARTARSQIIKQPDALMLHHLVPDEVEDGSLAPNLAFYGPRTAHGSSLSPAVHASLLARSGHPDEALELFRLAARLDLDDVTGTTAGGLHLATMGGVWQALAVGFLGLQPRVDVLEIAPRLPSAWRGLSMRFRFRAQPVLVRATDASVTVSCARPLTVRVGHGPPRVCEPPGLTFAPEGGMT